MKSVCALPLSQSLLRVCGVTSMYRVEPTSLAEVSSSFPTHLSGAHPPVLPSTSVVNPVLGESGGLKLVEGRLGALSSRRLGSVEI